MIEDDGEDFISLDDFECVTVNVTLENLTASTSIEKDSRIFGDVAAEPSNESLEIRLMEFDQEGVCLDVPEKTAAQGHHIRLVFDVVGAKLPFSFEAKGIVEKILPLSERREKFEVKFLEVDERFFEALKNLYDVRQKEIDSFLLKVRGY